MRELILCTALLATSVTVHSQQMQAPTDSDLRTAYCIPVVQNFLSIARSQIDSEDEYIITLHSQPDSPQRAAAEQAATKLRDDFIQGFKAAQSVLHRLQAYLIPREQYLEPMGLMVASNRGKADIKEGDDCVHACPTDQRAPECVVACSNPTKERFMGCFKPTWLPF